MKKYFLLAALALSTLSLAAPHEQGGYLEGNLGTLYLDTSLFGEHYSTFQGLGLNGNLGYQLSKNLATEWGYTRYLLNGSALNSTDLAVKAIFPFTIGQQDFYLFGKAGPSYLFNESDGLWKPFLGLGAGYQMNPKFDFNIQAQGIPIDYVNISLISAGLTYHFDL